MTEKEIFETMMQDSLDQLDPGDMPSEEAFAALEPSLRIVAKELIAKAATILQASGVSLIAVLVDAQGANDNDIYVSSLMSLMIPKKKNTSEWRRAMLTAVHEALVKRLLQQSERP